MSGTERGAAWGWLLLDAAACVVAFATGALLGGAMEANSPFGERVLSLVLILFWVSVWPAARLAPAYLESLAYPLPPTVRGWELAERLALPFLRAWLPGLAAMAGCYRFARDLPLDHWVVGAVSALVIGIGVQARLFLPRRHGVPSRRRASRWLPVRRASVVLAGCLGASVVLAGAPLLQLALAATAASFVYGAR